MREQKKQKKSANKIQLGIKRSKLTLKGTNAIPQDRNLLKDPKKTTNI